MNIIDYFESNPDEKILQWRGRIFQPLAKWIDEDTGKTITQIPGVVETDEDISYVRYIMRSWYEN